MADLGWIVVLKWEDFHHRDMARSKVPPWVKNATQLMSNDDYLNLTFHQRGILHGIWLEYARGLRQLRGSTPTLTRQLGERVMTRDLKALEQAGFITFSASKPASNPASLDGDREGDREKQQQNVAHANPQPPEKPAAADPLIGQLRTIGWNEAQLADARVDRELAQAWLDVALAEAESNPGGFAWSGFSGGVPPSRRTRQKPVVEAAAVDPVERARIAAQRAEWEASLAARDHVGEARDWLRTVDADADRDVVRRELQQRLFRRVEDASVRVAELLAEWDELREPTLEPPLRLLVGTLRAAGVSEADAAGRVGGWLDERLQGDVAERSRLLLLAAEWFRPSTKEAA